MKQNLIWNTARSLLLVGAGLFATACSQVDSATDKIEPGSEEHSHANVPTANIEVKTGAQDVQASASTPRSADSHIHGGAVLSIVSENKAIAIELETPLYNLLGFEYRPSTEEEKARVLEVEARLSQPHRLISFNKEAKCTFESPKTKAVLFETHATEENHGNDHDHNSDTAETAEDEHADHDDHEDEIKHKDVVLHYELRCEALSKLKAVRVEFFQHFPNFTELDLVYLSSTRQMSAELSRSRPMVDLTR